MTRAEAMLHRLASGIPASAKVVIVTAHPDDETLGLGGCLGLLDRATIVQLTDGAGGPPSRWTFHGCTTVEAYRALRRRERDAAMQAGGWSIPVRECGIPDQDAHAHLGALIDVVSLAIDGADAVFTHPYEGGHPDHDAAAYIVQAACDRVMRAPERLEFASYHWNGQRRVAGVFWPADGAREWAIAVTGDRLRRKQAALAEYRSQGSIPRRFNLAVERLRVAPRYDFTQAPATPECLYDRKQWAVSNADLRAAMARVA
jgi:LmbE family N-acetylglucosaminyl deacetylase